MNKGKSLSLGLLALVVAAYVALPTDSSATPINITVDPGTGLAAMDISKGLLGNNSTTTNFKFLDADVLLYNNLFAANLAAPMMAGFASFDSPNATPGLVSLTGYDYAVVHYGKGPGGIGRGGGIVFYYLNETTGNFAFPSGGLGPNGRGGISSIRLFAGSPTQNVPDGGATVALLGIAFAGVGAVRRFMKR